MATAGDLIDRALRLIGQIGAGASASPSEAADGLEALNALIESWRNEKLMAYTVEEVSLSLSNNTASYTIGPSGDADTTRPVDIESAWIEVDGITYPMRKMTEGEYLGIKDRSTQSDWPSRFLYRPAMATGTIIVWPVPNSAYTMKMLVLTPVLAFATTATSVSLPPGWERALAYNLAVELAPEFELPDAPPAVVRAALQAKGNLKRANMRPLRMRSEVAELVGPRGTANILSDS